MIVSSRLVARNTVVRTSWNENVAIICAFFLVRREKWAGGVYVRPKSKLALHVFQKVQ